MNVNDMETAQALRLLHSAETDAGAVDRRRFLQLVGMGAAAGAALGGPWTALDGLFGGQATAWAGSPVGPNDGILVLIGMYGGNDGLNTVVPVSDGLYYDQHGGLAIPPERTIRLSDRFGLHQSLPVLADFWNRGRLAIVRGVGYPNPDFSHFNSTAYWMAGRPNEFPTSGWVGRWLDGVFGATPERFGGAAIGDQLPLLLKGAVQRGAVVPPWKPTFGLSTRPIDRQVYGLFDQMVGAPLGRWGDRAMDAFSEQIQLMGQLGNIYTNDGLIPDEDIGAALETAARTINANLGFRMVSVGWNDFDSHADQPEMHGARMVEFNAAIQRFFATLDPAWSHRVTVMTYSEFGRTSWANDGAGTDHGSAGTHFVLGANVKGGWYGQQPSLAGLGRWDRMDHHVDFRSYFASLIDGWMGGGSSDVLGGTFENLNLFAAAPGQVPTDGGNPTPDTVPVGVTPAGFVPVVPFRLVDTRVGVGAQQAKIGADSSIRVQVTGNGGIPAAGVTAVVANVTAVGASVADFLTVYPGGTPRPGTSNLNGVPGRPVPNLVAMKVGADGSIEVYNSHGSVDCAIDVFGYFGTATGATSFTPLDPFRLFDSRNGSGVRAGKLSTGERVRVQVSGAGSVPTGATAVVMNLTAVQANSAGYLRLTPGDREPAETSNVNFASGQTIPNLAICKLDSTGALTVDAVGTGAHFLGDVFGYFGASGQSFEPLAPARALDTRTGIGAAAQPSGPNNAVRLGLAGSYGIPASATAVVLNVTAVGALAPTFVTVWPAGTGRPGTSNLNVVPGGPVANLVMCRLGDGAVSLQTPLASCHLIADVMGYYAGS